MSGLLNITCECGQRLSAKLENAGKSFGCPKCGKVITVPLQGSASTSDIFGLTSPSPVIEPPSSSHSGDSDTPVSNQDLLTDSPPQERFYGGLTGTLGRTLSFIGFGVCVWYMFVFDQSVDSSGSYSSSRVVNMGLANDRFIGMLWGSTLFLGGGLFQVVDTLKEIWKKS